MSGAAFDVGSVQGRDPWLLKDDPGLTGVRVRELIEPLGFRGSKSLASDFATEVSLLFDLILGGFWGPEP